LPSVNRRTRERRTIVDFCTRLREERDRLGLKQDELAERLGVSKASQSNYERGNRSPDAGYLVALVRLGADALYLLTGQRAKSVDVNALAVAKPSPPQMQLGRVIALRVSEADVPWLGQSTVGESSDLHEAARAALRHAPPNGHSDLLRDRTAGAVRPLVLSMPIRELGGPSREFELVPRHLRPAAAGNAPAGADAADQVDLVGNMAFSFEWLRANMGHTSGHITSIRVRGDSMATTLLDGDEIIIDEGVSAIDVDGIYVLDVYGRRLVKRVQHLVDGTLVLISDNPSYQRETIPRDLARNVRVIGRMVWPRVR
jgi:phage repressor protein C with HTH and peptisase S24 domain/DNA-binding XRE family transcriptional regulator